MTPGFSEFSDLEKSKTSTPMVIEQEHSLTHDGKASAAEESDGIRYQSSFDKDDSRAFSSRNTLHNLGPILLFKETPLYYFKEFLYGSITFIFFFLLYVEGFTHNVLAAEASGNGSFTSTSIDSCLKENLISFNSSAPSEPEFWRVEQQDVALKNGISWVIASSGAGNNQKCFNCKQKNHTTNHCPYPEKIRVCQTCSNPGHNAKSCPFCLNVSTF